jgi:hypothetical protein
MRLVKLTRELMTALDSSASRGKTQGRLRA